MKIVCSQAILKRIVQPVFPSENCMQTNIEFNIRFDEHLRMAAIIFDDKFVIITSLLT